MGSLCILHFYHHNQVMKEHIHFCLQLQRDKISSQWGDVVAGGRFHSKSRQLRDHIFNDKQAATRENMKQGKAMHSQSLPLVSYYLQLSNAPPQLTPTKCSRAESMGDIPIQTTTLMSQHHLFSIAECGHGCHQKKKKMYFFIVVFKNQIETCKSSQPAFCVLNFQGQACPFHCFCSWAIDSKQFEGQMLMTRSRIFFLFTKMN